MWDTRHFHVRFLGDHLGHVGATWLCYPSPLRPSHWNPSTTKSPSALVESIRLSALLSEIRFPLPVLWLLSHLDHLFWRHRRLWLTLLIWSVCLWIYPYQLILWIVLYILFWFLLLSEPTDEPTFMLCFSSLLDVWLLGTLLTYNATMENPSYDEECSFYLTWIFRSLFKITAKRTTGTILPIAQALTQGTRELKQDIYKDIASIPSFNQWFEEFCAFDSRCFWY